MPTHTLAFFALSLQASALELAKCQGKSVWLTVPVEKSEIEKWLDSNLQPADRQQVVLDDAPGYNSSTRHPVQIEWDSFHSCKSVGGIPYPDFNEVAAMIPYVRWQNKTGVHFQPWSIVNNIFGASAMLLTGSKHVTESSGGVRYPTPPANWAQWTEKDSGALAGFCNVSARVETLVNSSLLESTDAAWREMANLKRTKSVTYDRCAFGWKYSCNRIQWDIQKAAKVTDGWIGVTRGANNSHFFPALIGDSIASLREKLPGFEVYAAQTVMSAVIGCGSTNQIIV